MRIQAIFIFFAISLNFSVCLSQQILPPKPWDPSNKQFIQFFKHGSIEGFYSKQQVDRIMKSLLEEYKDILREEVFGTTYQKRDMKAYFLRTGNRSKGSVPQLLFMSGIHSNELITYEQNLLLLFYLLNEYDLKKQNMLSSGLQIIFIPIMNIDGSVALQEYYKKNHQYKMFRKNRHGQLEITNPSDQDVGVDLNRNWDILFGTETKGSRVYDQTSGVYQGEKALSEPETHSLDQFITKIQKNLVAVFSLHAFGNCFCSSYNFDKDKSNAKFKKEFPHKVEKLQFMKQNFHFPKSFSIGNAAATIGYTTTGQFTDYMNHKYPKIITISPEAGVEDQNSKTFELDNFQKQKVLVQNLKWMIDFLKFSHGAVGVKKTTFANDENKIIISLKNIGFLPYRSHNAEIKLFDKNQGLVSSKKLDPLNIKPNEQKQFEIDVKDSNFSSAQLTLNLYSDGYSDQNVVNMDISNKAHKLVQLSNSSFLAGKARYRHIKI